ncbi:hypothetical protein ACJX0J_011651 [Zea mays]
MSRWFKIDAEMIECRLIIVMALPQHKIYMLHYHVYMFEIKKQVNFDCHLEVIGLVQIGKMAMYKMERSWKNLKSLALSRSHLATVKYIHHGNPTTRIQLMYDSVLVPCLYLQLSIS